MRVDKQQFWRASIGLTLGGTLAVCAAPTIRRAMRPDITDPDLLATQPLKELRDSELETLIRAAFLEASEITVQSEGSAQRGARRAIISHVNDRERLAALFIIGSDQVELPNYGHPGLMYTRVKFDGPFEPNFVFTSPKEILIFPDVHRSVRTEFAKAVADEIKLPIQP